MIEKLKYQVIKVFRNYSLPRWLVLIIDIAAVFLTFLFAYMLRFNLEPYGFSFKMAINQGLLVSVVYLSFMLIFKSYSGLIRQTTIKDTFIIAVTNTSSLILLAIVTIFSRRSELNPLFNISISILLIHFITVLYRSYSSEYQ